MAKTRLKSLLMLKRASEIIGNTVKACQDSASLLFDGWVCIYPSLLSRRTTGNSPPGFKPRMTSMSVDNANKIWSWKDDLLHFLPPQMAVQREVEIRLLHRDKRVAKTTALTAHKRLIPGNGGISDYH